MMFKLQEEVSHPIVRLTHSAEMKAKKPKVFVIYTGGTMGMKRVCIKTLTDLFTFSQLCISFYIYHCTPTTIIDG